MRNKRRGKRRISPQIAVFSFSPALVFAAAKVLPMLSVAAILCAGVNMPEGARAVMTQTRQSEQPSISICDSTIELNAKTEEIKEPSQPENTGERQDGEIIYKHYGYQNGDNYIDLIHGQIRNCTHLTNEQVISAATLRPEFTIEPNSEPQVLIYHTHATESFEPYERSYYDASYPTRNRDTTQNMVAVGDAITEELEALGIGVIHSDELHDYPSYTGSYANSAKTIKAALEQYPSIKVVLDIHRDAIEADGTRYAAVAEIDGKNASQVMIISGCDDGTMNYPNYLQNLRLASLFQQQIEADYPGLTRPILLDYRKYNQDLSTGGLLFEIGSHGNTLDQSIYTGHLVGKSIGKALLTLNGEQ